MIVIGLTGSIAMGKSETAKLFREQGVPVFDSDEEVHRLYEAGGAAVEPLARIFPEALTAEGTIDRSVLSRLALKDAGVFKSIENIVHPLIRERKAAFLKDCKRAGTPIAVIDVPLLFETRQEKDVDKIVVVSAPEEIQRQRALSRPGMTQQKLDAIMDRQLPDAEKRRRADFVVDTSTGIDGARDQVTAILNELKSKMGSAGERSHSGYGNDRA